MWTSIIVALITGVFSLIGVVLSNLFSSTKMERLLEKNQAVFEVKIQNLTDEVKEHNNFAKRMPVVEEQIKVINHRLDDLEKNK